MSEASKDSQRAVAAAKAILDGRDLFEDRASVMVTLEHLVAMLLIVAMHGDHRMAVGMLNEGLVPGVEERIALHASKST